MPTQRRSKHQRRHRPLDIERLAKELDIKTSQQEPIQHKENSRSICIGRQIEYAYFDDEMMPQGGKYTNFQRFGSFVVPYMVGFTGREAAAKALNDTVDFTGQLRKIEKELNGEETEPRSPFMERIQFGREIKGEGTTDGQKLYVQIPYQQFIRLREEQEQIVEAIGADDQVERSNFGLDIELGTFSRSSDAKRGRAFFEQHMPKVTTLGIIGVFGTEQETPIL